MSKKMAAWTDYVICPISCIWEVAGFKLRFTWPKKQSLEPGLSQVCLMFSPVVLIGISLPGNSLCYLPAFYDVLFWSSVKKLNTVIQRTNPWGTLKWEIFDPVECKNIPSLLFPTWKRIPKPDGMGPTVTTGMKFYQGFWSISEHYMLPVMPYSHTYIKY